MPSIVGFRVHTSKNMLVRLYISFEMLWDPPGGAGKGCLDYAAEQSSALLWPDSVYAKTLDGRMVVCTTELWTCALKTKHASLFQDLMGHVLQ